MKKLIISLILTGLFLLSGSQVMAASEAGQSALISHNYKITSKDLEEVAEYKTKAAIKAVLEKYDSPLLGEVDAFYNTCRKYKLDCYLLPSIAGLESSFGKFLIPGTYNPFGWGRGLIEFKNFADAIDTVGRGLRENYMDKWHAQTIDEIGRIYCEGNTWASHVSYFVREFKAQEDKIQLFLEANPVQL